MPRKLVALHAAAPDVGRVEVTTPSSSTPTHKRADGHETAWITGAVANGGW
jgi:hypothetical protein